jgi:3-hydroxyacyl-[acyl-carrier-protein] dehydratase
LLDRLPHRPPFRFITGDVQIADGREGSATWNVNGDEVFLRGHFPGAPIVPGVLIGEALAQLSCLIALDQMDRQQGADAAARHQGRLAHIELRFNHAVVPPASIRLESRLTRIFATLWQFEVSALVGELVVARGHLALSIIGGSGGEEAPQP